MLLGTDMYANFKTGNGEEENRGMDHNAQYLVENEMGLFVHEIREAKGYTMEEISQGICSLATLSRIEAGERTVDFIMIEALLDRMKISKSEYEFVLDEEDYDLYMKREEIRKEIYLKQYSQAEKLLRLYEKEHGEKHLHNQFVYFQKALLEQNLQRMERKKVRELFQKAIEVTAAEYQQTIKLKGILSDTELFCITGLINCCEDSKEKEEKQEELYEYFSGCCIREKLFPVPYRSAMGDYAECLYENEKYELCIRICNEVLEELYKTSKLENREKIFKLRAMAREKKGFKDETEKNQCLRDFLTAYYVMEFYGEEDAERLKQHIEEEYGWQFTE